MNIRRVLIYGGFSKVNREMHKHLPDNVEVHFMDSTRKRLDLSSIGQYDLVVSFWTNISHSAGAAVKAAAKRHHVPYRLLVSKGAEMACAEIATALAV